jgi:dipeptidyl aminopeptidase/acylaminoacyl peptidase
MNTVRILTAGKRKIEGTMFLPDSSRQRHAGALFLHGWRSDRQKHVMPAQLLSELGFVSLTVDLRGHGKTGQLEHAVSVRDNLQDVTAAFDFLVSRDDVDRNRIVLAGFSYGGFLAILLAAERKVRWLALRSPALYRDEDLDTPKAEIKRRGLMAFRRRPLSLVDCAGLRAAANVRGHVLLVEAQNDRVVPHQQIRNYLKAFEHAKSVAHRVIRGAHHAMSPEHYRIAVGTLVEWLKIKAV